MRLSCVRIDCVTGTARNEFHKAKLKHSEIVGWSVQLDPGVTGYESFMVSDMLKRDDDGSWTACAGTPGSWDKLIVGGSEMERLRDVLRLLPIL